MACDAGRQPREQAFLCSLRYEFYLAETCELEGLSCCLEAGFRDLLLKNTKPVCTLVSEESYRSHQYFEQP